MTGAVAEMGRGVRRAAGTAELIDDPDKTLSHTVSHKYLNQDPPAEPADVHRLIVRPIPDKIITLAV